MSCGRTRLSTLASGVFPLILVLTLGDLVARIPMAVIDPPGSKPMSG